MVRISARRNSIFVSWNFEFHIAEILKFASRNSILASYILNLTSSKFWPMRVHKLQSQFKLTQLFKMNSHCSEFWSGENQNFAWNSDQWQYILKSQFKLTRLSKMNSHWSEFQLTEIQNFASPKSNFSEQVIFQKKF